MGVNGTIDLLVFIGITSSIFYSRVSITYSIIKMGKVGYYISNPSSYGIYWYYMVRYINKNNVDKSMMISLVTLLIHWEVALVYQKRISLL